MCRPCVFAGRAWRIRSPPAAAPAEPFTPGRGVAAAVAAAVPSKIAMGSTPSVKDVSRSMGSYRGFRRCSLKRGKTTLPFESLELPVGVRRMKRGMSMEAWAALSLTGLTRAWHTMLASHSHTLAPTHLRLHLLPVVLHALATRLTHDARLPLAHARPYSPSPPLAPSCPIHAPTRSQQGHQDA